LRRLTVNNCFISQRSANAAKDIKELIDDSVDKVSAGSILVEQAGSRDE
jgi:methyl-accepting chemotaxis protein